MVVGEKLVFTINYQPCRPGTWCIEPPNWQTLISTSLFIGLSVGIWLALTLWLALVFDHRAASQQPAPLAV